MISKLLKLIREEWIKYKAASALRKHALEPLKEVKKIIDNMQDPMKK